MSQLLLFPDPRPLVERLGREFFRGAPECPGVYLMRDAADTVLYVGKARNLRKRLGSYRVANPDRMPRRHLRLLRAVVRIELQECPDESAALAREFELLRSLQPRFNRAGTWPGTPRFLAWRVTEGGLEMAVVTAVEPGWFVHGPLGAGAIYLRASLVRLLWCVIHPQRGLAGMPQGWFHGPPEEAVMIPCCNPTTSDFEESAVKLKTLFDGHPDEFTQWILERTMAQNHPFEVALRTEDLEDIAKRIVKEPPTSM